MNLQTKLWTVYVSYLPLKDNKYNSRKNLFLHVLCTTAERAIELVHNEKLNDCQVWSVNNRGNYTSEGVIVDPGLLTPQ